MATPDILYNQIGTGYNNTRQADPFIAESLSRLLSPKPEGIYLDIGCGTGNYTTALADIGLQLYGVEPSETMLGAARSCSEKVTWLQGSAEQIPADDAQFDGAIATLTVHHWTDLNKAFAELNRVLRSGSRMAIFTATPEQMRGYWLNYYFPQMMERSVTQMPAAETIVDAAVRAGFTFTGNEKYFIQPDLKDLFLYSGKHDPQRYFDEGVRHGISSFSALANGSEVIEGLSRLDADMAAGEFASIKSRYENDLGDYLFIVLTKL